MVSKNNLTYRWEHDTKMVPHYGLRKFSVGVASVLLGTTVGLGISTGVSHADTVDANAGSAPVSASASTTQAVSPATASTQSAVAQAQTTAQTNLTTVVGDSATVNAVNQYANQNPQALATPVQQVPASQAAPAPTSNVSGLYGTNLMQQEGQSGTQYQNFYPNVTSPNSDQGSNNDVKAATHKSWDISVAYNYATQNKDFSEATFYAPEGKQGQEAAPATKTHIDVLSTGESTHNELQVAVNGTKVGDAQVHFQKEFDGTKDIANPTPQQLADGDIKGHHYTVYEIDIPLKTNFGWQYVQPVNNFKAILTVDHVNNGTDVTQVRQINDSVDVYDYGTRFKVHYHSDDGKIDDTVDGPFVTSINGQQNLNYNIPKGYKLVNDNQVKSIEMVQDNDDPTIPALKHDGDGGWPGDASVIQNGAVIDVPLTLATIKSSWTGQFVDQDNNNSPVGNPDVINGDSGKAFNIDMTVPDNYALAPGVEIPTSVTLHDQPVSQQISLVHKHHVYHPGDPNSDQYGLTQDIVRTINVHNPKTNKVDVTKQDAKLTRNVDVDLVNGHRQYTSWTTGNWDAFTTPDVIGWTPDNPGVSAQPVKDGDKDQTIDINYTRDTGSWTGQFVDQDNNNSPVGNPVTITGNDGDQGKPSMVIPDNYELAPGAKLPDTITFTDGHVAAKIPLVHKTHIVKPGDPDAGQYLLTHDATRTINFKGLENVKNAPKAEVQKAEVTRTAKVDNVTKQVLSYTPWSKSSWKSYNAPHFDGYTANPTSIAEAPVDENTKDTTAVIDYVKNGSWTGQFVDKDNNNAPVGDPVKITGDKGSKHDVKMNIPDNYELVPGTTIPATVTMDGTDQVVKIPLQHKTRTITGDDPDADKYGTRKTITRTIIMHNPDKTDSKVSQPVTLKRTATQDLVTKKILSYTPWNEGDWPEFDVPKIDHFKATPDVVNTQHVTVDDKDTTVEVIYTDERGTWTGHFVDRDENNKVVGTPTEIKGDAGSTQKVNMTIPDGYELAKGETIPDSVTLKQGAQTQEIGLVHKHEIVNAGDPDAKKYNLDLKKAVTRTIVFKGLDDKKDPVVQKVVLLRSADVDLVTKEAKYTDWTTDQWPAFDVPEVDGYTADKKQIPVGDVNGQTQDQIVVVNYTKNQESETPASQEPVSQAPSEVAQTPAPASAAQPAVQAAPAVQASPVVATAAPVAQAAPAPAAPARQAALPQTGNEQNEAMAAIGLGLVSLAMGSALLGKKRLG